MNLFANDAFNGRIAFVTGATRGIGLAIAERLADAGAFVIGTATSETGAASISEKLGARGRGIVLDVTNAEAAVAAVNAVVTEFGRIDILVNNAGITKDGLMMRMSEQDWEDVISTNLSSAFFWVKGLLRPMTKKRWGRIVNISSVVGVQGNAGQANYASAKAGLIGLTKSLAKEFATRSITVNAVAPGFITTDMTAALPEEIQQKIKSVIPLARFGSPEDIAGTVDFLCSENAGYITGQVFSVDGGMAM